MRTYTIQAVILKRKNVGEADRILTVFTREQGKMQIKAKGVRKVASKRASHIEPLNITTLTIYEGQGMPILTEAVSFEYFGKTKENLKRLALAYHVCELVDGLCVENQESEKIYEKLINILHEVNTGENIGKKIHDFEVELLYLLGYWSYDNGDLAGSKASFFIESILERKLKTRKLLPQLLS